MKNALVLLILCFSVILSAQKKKISKKSPAKKNLALKHIPKINPDLIKINDSIPALIPKKEEGKFGFINQKGKVVIKPEYSNVGFFTEDCNLQNSTDAKVMIYGSNKFASVRLNDVDYRINEIGKRVYQFKDSDLGKCKQEIKTQLFHGYILGKYYGIIEDSKFENPADYKQFTIYPQYDYLHILEGDDLNNPMIIAVRDDKFGVIDIRNKIIIPFQYSDIKRNYSWKLARLFEVTEDGTNYFYIDVANKKY
ncbi:WG repeat-containing protein [Kaistella sp. G5-32]|uniref:WG repeat-containing protein n=2 Tax=Kaistella gelatinilytica TaxID=2787636 RepID=A0ABS0FCX4_9FLAO|nr:WG repeat-containing protein [Kaistella gelatinilytica]